MTLVVGMGIVVPVPHAILLYHNNLLQLSVVLEGCSPLLGWESTGGDIMPAAAK